MAKHQRYRGGSYRNHTGTHGGFQVEYIYKLFGNWKLVVRNTTAINYSSDSRVDSESSIIDYIHEPGTSFEKTQPMYDALYYTSNPSFKYCKHVKTNFLVNVLPAQTIRSQYHPSYTSYAEFRFDGYPPYSDCNFNLWTIPHQLLSNDLYVGAIIKPKGFSYGTGDDHSVIRELLDDNNLFGLPDVNLIQSVFELRDLRRLCDIVKFKHFDDRLISDKFLGVEFGVLPLISDLKKISKVWNNLDSSFDKWNQMARNGTVRNAHKTFHDELIEGSHVDTQDHKVSTVYYSLRVTAFYEQKVVRRASVYYRPDELTSGSLPMLKASIWGLNRPLSAAWELVPFSFAVDWVVNIGDMIDDFEISEPSANMHVMGAGISTSMETHIRTTVELIVNEGTFLVGEVFYTDTSYIREPIMPSVLSSLFEDKSYGPLEFTPELSGEQTVLSSALVHQFLRK